MSTEAGGTGNTAAPGEPAPRSRSALLDLFVGTVVVSALAFAWFALVQARGLFYERDALTVGILLVVAIGYDLVVRRVERARRLTSAGPYVNMTSVWLLSSALALAAPWTVLVLLVLYSYDEAQTRHDGIRRPAYRVAFNGAAALIAILLAHYVGAVGGGVQTLQQAGLVQWAAVIGAVLVSAVVNAVLVAIAIILASGSFTVAKVVGSFTDNLLEIATLALGAFVAIAVVVNVWFCVLAIPAMMLLQRSALVEQLESAASQDSKTGLLTFAAWQYLAERHMARNAARRDASTVLIVDLDHFKDVNDTYGHLAGDDVLRAVAGAMKGMLRDHDLLSRFGGEEFIALLPGADATEALVVAERLRARVAEVVVTPVGDPPEAVLTAGDPIGAARADGIVPAHNSQIRVTVSVGLASFPWHGETLNALVAKADAALYAAKHAGRNRVRVSP